jgi:peptide/nickel transport system permease protein
LKFFAKKIAALLFTMFLVSILTFIAFNLIPGDPVQLMLGTNATPQSLAEMRSQLGLDRSLPERYAAWAVGLLHGDMGTSIQYSRPVSSLLWERLPVTAWLAVLSLLLIFLCSVPVGILSARTNGTPVGKFLDSLTMLNLSLPGYFFGILFVWVFGVLLRCFVPGGYVDWREDFGGFLRFLFFPAAAVAVPNIATAAKFLRSSVLAELDCDYVRTALGKGCGRSAILYKHILKNASIPVITLFGMMTAEVFSGSIIVEQVFSLPGIGRLLISSVSARDFPLIESLVVYIAFFVVVANFLADVLIRCVDPRMREKA